MSVNRVVVCSSYQGIQDGTRAAISSLVRHGWAAHVQTGCADVALARNLALSAVLRKTPNKSEYVVLMVDDDMAFTLDDAQRITDMAEQLQRPVSGLYATMKGTVAAVTFERLSLSGLGFLAVPAQRLHALAEQSRVGVNDGEEFFALTWTGMPDEKEQRLARDTMWLSEDYRLTMRLGGVVLARLAVGHIKPVPLYPDEETLERYGHVAIR